MCLTLFLKCWNCSDFLYYQSRKPFPPSWELYLHQPSEMSSRRRDTPDLHFRFSRGFNYLHAFSYANVRRSDVFKERRSSLRHCTSHSHSNWRRQNSRAATEAALDQRSSPLTLQSPFPSLNGPQKIKKYNIILPRIKACNSFYSKAIYINNSLAHICRQEGIGFFNFWDDFYNKDELFFPGWSPFE